MLYGSDPLPASPHAFETRPELRARCERSDCRDDGPTLHGDPMHSRCLYPGLLYQGVAGAGDGGTVRVSCRKVVNRQMARIMRGIRLALSLFAADSAGEPSMPAEAATWSCEMG
jgi:hypothetical protein